MVGISPFSFVLGMSLMRFLEMSSERRARVASLLGRLYFCLRSLRWSGVVEEEIWRVGAKSGCW